MLVRPPTSREFDIEIETIMDRQQQHSEMSELEDAEENGKSKEQLQLAESGKKRQKKTDLVPQVDKPIFDILMK